MGQIVHDHPLSRRLLNAGLAVENYFVDPNSSEISAIDELIAKSLGMSDDDTIKLHLW